LAAAGPDPAPAIAGDILTPPYVQPGPAQTPFTGFIRCAGRVTHCR
jgi:hypothetical protein